MKTRNVKTADLTRAPLDWAVTVAMGMKYQIVGNSFDTSWLEDRPDGSRSRVFGRYRPSTDWGQGGPLISEYMVRFVSCHVGWDACLFGGHGSHGQAETHLIAACRAIAAAKLGDTVDVPEVLL